MSSDSIGVTNAVRVRQGRDPINPFSIEGFGGNEPPPPPIADLPEPLSSEPWLEEGDGPAEGHGQAVPVSPLVPPGFGAPVQVAPPVPQGIAMPDLVIYGPVGNFKGTEVELDETDQKAVATIVLRAAQRKFALQLSELSGRRVRRPRKARVGDGQSSSVPVAVAAPGEPAAPPVKRKRGRPRKHPLPVVPPQPDPDPSV